MPSQAEYETRLKNISILLLQSEVFVLIEKGLLKLILYIGLLGYESGDEFKKEAFVYFEFLEKGLKLNDLKKIWHLTSLFFEQNEANDLIGNDKVLPKSLQFECDKTLEKLNGVSSEEIQESVKKITPFLKILSNNPSVSINFRDSLKYLYKKSKEKDSEAKKARAALHYLALEKDVIPDDLGIFGLADDIYVVEKIAAELGGLSFGEELYFEFDTLAPRYSALFFQDEKQLLPISKQTELFLKSCNILLQKQTGRFAFVLPDVSMAAYLFLISVRMNFQEIIKSKSETIDFSIGEKIYFFFKAGRVAVEAIYGGVYDSPANLYGMPARELHRINFSKNTSRTVGKEFLRYAQKNISSKTKVFNNQEAFNELSLAELLPVISHSLGRNTFPFPIIFLTRKNKFDDLFHELSPFGLNLSDLLKFKYSKKNSDEVELFGHGGLNISEWGCS